MLRALYYSKDKEMQADLDLIDAAFALQDPDGLLWMDFDNSDTEQVETVLQKTFEFHPLAINNALREAHVPKLDDWGKYLYIVLHAVVFDDSKSGGMDTLELDVFLEKITWSHTTNSR